MMPCQLLLVLAGGLSTAMQLLEGDETVPADMAQREPPPQPHLPPHVHLLEWGLVDSRLPQAA